MSEKYAFICTEEGNYPVVKMCHWAHVSRSGYYEWRGRGPSATARWRKQLAALVSAEFDHSDGTYGYRRVHAALLRRGYCVDDETVRSIMREQGLVACQPRPFRPTTTIAGDAARVPDLLCRDFTATAPGRTLVGDITYLHTWEGWLYLATVLDCYSKKVVGYAMADHMRTCLVTDALAMAQRNNAITPEITIFHSDRGCQGGLNRSSTRPPSSPNTPTRSASSDHLDAPEPVTITPGRNPSTARSRSSACTAPHIPQGNTHALT